MRRICLLTVLFAVLAAPSAHAKVLFVTTGSDLIDYGGGCSLRDAVRSANEDIPRGGCQAGVGDDEIQLPAGTVALGITGKYDDLTLYGDLDVNGGALIVRGSAQGTIIDAAGIDRVFEADTPLALEDLTIRGGRPGPDGTAGANLLKSWGGAILARNDLSVQRVTFEDNATADGVVGSGSVGGFGGSGGAVTVLGASSLASIVDSVFQNNRTGNGAAKPSAGLSGGRGGDGGALTVYLLASLTVSGSRFSGNRTGAGGSGGGSFATGGAGSAITGGGQITNSLISGNTVGAGTIGGGGGGGAIRDASLRHVTVAGNAVDGDANNFIPNGVYGGSVSASILTGSGRVCVTVADDGDNVSPADSDCPGAGADPQLDANLIPAADSPAIDRATGTCPATDVRGVARPQGAGCDAGAIERRPTTLTLAPAALTFPELLPGATSPAQSVAVNYAGDGALKLGALSTTGDFAASGCGGAVFVDAGSCTISVGFTPTLAGARTGTLTLATAAGPRTVSLEGVSVAVGGPPSGPATPPSGTGPSGSSTPAAGTGTSDKVARISATGASLRRVRGRLRLRVTLRCAGLGSCDELLRVRVSRPGRKVFFATRRLRLPAGGRRTESLTLSRALARGLRSKAKLSVRLRLVKAGRRTTELRLTRRTP